MEKFPLSPTGKGRPHPFFCSFFTGRDLSEEVSVQSSFLLSASRLGRDGKFLLSDRCSPPHHLHPQGWGSPKASPPAPNYLPDPRRRREEGEPRPPRAAPPLSTESSEEEGSEPDSEGFRRLRLGGRREGGGSSSSPDSEPWVDEQIKVSTEGRWAPEALKSGNWGQENPRPKESPSLPPGEVIYGESKRSGSYFPQVVQPHPTSFLPANSLKASGNACDGASCPFCRVSGLCCGGAGIPSGGGRREGEEGGKVSPRKDPVSQRFCCLL